MKKIILLATPIFLLIAWFFVGLDRYVGDHEVGAYWDPFIKHRPNTTVFYQNPAQIGLDIVPFADLDASRKEKFIRYCQVRYGATDTKSCYELILAGRY